MIRNKLFRFCLLMLCIHLSFFSHGQDAGQSESEKALAFPGADGFGKYTSGGRGGKVYVVTNLHDEGPGSLREAIRKKEPRIIVFVVSGNIKLKSSLDINHGDLTIAGQSAPGGGITLQHYPMKIKGDNVIIRYIRSRMGDEEGVQDDAMSSLRNKDVIIDHCSLSWATDECGSFYDNENFTLQWCIISESLNASVHEKGNHGYGGIWGGNKATFHHNLIANHASRLPRFNGARTSKDPQKEVVDFRNNVIYNWKSNNAYGGEQGHYNMVGNFYQPGPATTSNEDRVIEPYAPYGQFYLAENTNSNDCKVSQDNRLGVDGVEAAEKVLVGTPFPFIMGQETEKASIAYLRVLRNAGASYSRDQVDKRLLKEVRKGKSTAGKNHDGIIDSQDDVGGWPKLTSKKALRTRTEMACLINGRRKWDWIAMIHLMRQEIIFMNSTLTWRSI
ncbi:pectate lyase family protein [Echinicola strongylocentroti]|uniref:pectate lyase family protein n=1 Tax=Echinicola strongylocentroti TaxID=1795355 RepID=UPI0026D0C130|nr:pectate lyase [Echinicola strongylocentroti]